MGVEEGLEEKLRKHVQITIENAEYEVIDEPTKTTCKTVYVIYTEKSGPIKWTFSRSEAKSYTSKNKSYRFKAVELL